MEKDIIIYPGLGRQGETDRSGDAADLNDSVGSVNLLDLNWNGKTHNGTS
jgi:hypothetical protein